MEIKQFPGSYVHAAVTRVSVVCLCQACPCLANPSALVTRHAVYIVHLPPNRVDREFYFDYLNSSEKDHPADSQNHRLSLHHE